MDMEIPLSAFSFQLSAISYQSSGISAQTESCELTALCYLL
jgi:hypothetical protein